MPYWNRGKASVQHFLRYHRSGREVTQLSQSSVAGVWSGWCGWGSDRWHYGGQGSGTETRRNSSWTWQCWRCEPRCMLCGMFWLKSVEWGLAGCWSHRSQWTVRRRCRLCGWCHPEGGCSMRLKYGWICTLFSLICFRIFLQARRMSAGMVGAFRASSCRGWSGLGW